MRNTAILWILTIILGSTGCGQRSHIQGRKVFRYNESKGITSLDPAQARTMGNIWAVGQIFNGLVQMGEGMKIEPCIAKRWEISDNGRVYRFYLQNDVRFHDHPLFEDGKGRRVVASDFEYSFKRILDERTLSPGRWIFNWVDTARSGGFRALNDSALEIYLSRSFPPFLSILSMQYCSVVPMEVAEALGKDFGRHPVGTGPFKFKEWYEGIKLVLLRNDQYFEHDYEGNPLPYLDAVGITFTPDPKSAFLEFLKGDIDMLSGLEDGSYKDALITPNGNLMPDMVGKVMMRSQPFLNTEYLGFLLKDTVQKGVYNPLMDKRVRQAINYGIDRVKMIRYIRNNIGSPGVHGFLPDGLPGGSGMRVEGYCHNPELAKHLLAEAGYPKGKGLPEIELFTTPQYVDLCEYLQHQLSDIGIRISIQVNPGGTHGALVANSQVAFFRKSWIADYPDAENFLALFYSKNFTPSGPNYTLFSNAEFDKLYESALTTVDDSLRLEQYRLMDSIIVEEAPVVVLYYDQVLRFVHPGISGLGTNAMNTLSLKRVRKD